MRFGVSGFMSVAILGLVAFPFFWGCGRKTPPIPYGVSVPRAISDLEGLVRKGKVFLAWSAPRKAVDGSAVGPLREFRILRGEFPLEESWCEECPEALEPLAVLSLEETVPRVHWDGRLVYQDGQVDYGHVYVYRVITVNARGYKSDLSNRTVIYWDTPPGPPRRLEGEAGDGEAALTWEPVEGVGGYRIYRRREGREFGPGPVATVAPERASYRDTGLLNGMTYFYTVRSVRKVKKTWLEGTGSEEVSLTPRDLTAPAPPQGLVAIPLAGGIELTWQRNTESDLLGYFVYRRDRTGEEYMRLNESPLEAPLYVDRTAVLSRSYEYAVTAVDASPQRNESDFSESVTITYVR